MAKYPEKRTRNNPKIRDYTKLKSPKEIPKKGQKTLEVF